MGADERMKRNSFICWLIHVVSIVVISVWEYCDGRLLMMP